MTARDVRSVLLTGPSGRTAEWASAARDAGWEPLVHELLAVRPRAFDVPSAPAWLVVASANAAPALAAHAGRLASATVACVGERTAAALAALGLAPALGPFDDAAGLVAALASRLPRNARVLCPRGDRSDELARSLADLGARVDAPIAYEVRERRVDAPLPAASAVLFASPSCAAAWRAASREPRASAPAALALGETTRAALEAIARAESSLLGPILVLARPHPAALAAALAALVR